MSTTYDQSSLEKGADILILMRGYQKMETLRTENFTDITALDTRANHKILIRIVNEPKTKSGVSVSQVREMEKILAEKGFERGIMIGEKRFLSSSRKEAIQDNIELFSGEALPMFKVFNHIFVPKHEILSEKETEAVLKEYRVKPYQLPHIRSSDPVIRLIGGKPGDVIKITRGSLTAGSAAYYRYVV